MAPRRKPRLDAAAELACWRDLLECGAGYFNQLRGVNPAWAGESICSYAKPDQEFLTAAKAAWAKHGRVILAEWRPMWAWNRQEPEALTLWGKP